MFFGPQVSVKFGICFFFETFDQFSLSSLEMREFSLSNLILLSLVDISNVFYDNIWVNIKVKMSETMSTIQILS